MEGSRRQVKLMATFKKRWAETLGVQLLMALDSTSYPVSAKKKKISLIPKLARVTSATYNQKTLSAFV
jgi:hypothetical protein